MLEIFFSSSHFLLMLQFTLLQKMVAFQKLALSIKQLFTLVSITNAAQSFTEINRFVSGPLFIAGAIKE